MWSLDWRPNFRVKGAHNKVKWKKIRPYKIMRKFRDNTCDIEIFKWIDISLIFNVSN